MEVYKDLIIENNLLYSDGVTLICVHTKLTSEVSRLEFYPHKWHMTFLKKLSHRHWKAILVTANLSTAASMNSPQSVGLSNEPNAITLKSFSTISGLNGWRNTFDPQVLQKYRSRV